MSDLELREVSVPDVSCLMSLSLPTAACSVFPRCQLPEVPVSGRQLLEVSVADVSCL
jgi:hypothetical protein